MCACVCGMGRGGVQLWGVNLLVTIRILFAAAKKGEDKGEYS